MPKHKDCEPQNGFPHEFSEYLFLDILRTILTVLLLT